MGHFIKLLIHTAMILFRVTDNEMNGVTIIRKISTGDSLSTRKSVGIDDLHFLKFQKIPAPEQQAYNNICSDSNQIAIKVEVCNLTVRVV